MKGTSNPVWTAVWPAALLFGFGLACGGGATFGENSPGNAQYGGGTYVDDAFVTSETPEGVGENGSLAVDPDTEFTYTLQARRVDGVEHKRLVVVPPDEAARELMDLDGYVDIRVLFPAQSVLVMAQPAWSEAAVANGTCLQPDDDSSRRCGDELIWFDKSARRKIGEQRTRAWYHGTRLSPKRNFLIVADNFKSPATLHLIDAENGHTNVVPQDGSWFEGMWMHQEDVLVTAHFGNLGQGDDAEAYLEIREWFPAEDSGEAELTSAVCFVTGEQMPEGCTTYVVPDIEPMFTVGFSWIGISPDDRYVAVPAANADGAAVVFLVDRLTDELHAIDEMYGPVGFTPDSSTMIGFGFDEPAHMSDSFPDLLNYGTGEGPHLKIVDLATLEVTIEPTPEVDTPTFVVSHDSSHVVVVNTFGGDGMAIIDLDTQGLTEMAGPRVATHGRAALERDLAEPGFELNDRELAARDAASRRQMVVASDVCRDRVCHTGEGMVVSLGEFVSRVGSQELWLLEGGKLVRVDLELGFAEEVQIDGEPRHINILPKRDRLVIDQLHEQTLRFFDPSTRRVESATSIELGWTEL